MAWTEAARAAAAETRRRNSKGKVKKLSPKIAREAKRTNQVLDHMRDQYKNIKKNARAMTPAQMAAQRKKVMDFRAKFKNK